ncbi:MAG: suppressor of fused domain protein [Pseudomonas sp.]|nr:suppressor of fused domain protein [Pseudomonas sp.]
MDLAGLYYDHYQKFLGVAVDNLIFESPALDCKIQILVYAGVFEGCITFATVGLSHYSRELGGVGEIVCVVDALEEEVPGIIFNTIKTIVLDRMELGWGIGISGNSKVAPKFVEVTSKDCVYITNPLPFPEGFSFVDGCCEGRSSLRVYLMIFISSSEYQIFCERGGEGLEHYLWEREIDPFHVMRA